MTKVTPFLMFTGRAQEAIELYGRLFDDFEVLSIKHWKDSTVGEEGKIEESAFRIANQTFRAFDSPPYHEFDFTPSLSLFIDCETEEQIDRLASGLSKGGYVMMALSDEYPFADKYTWLSDRFGVSWQLSFIRDTGQAA